VVSYAADRGPDTTKEFLRVGNPRDIGYAALWLAADESEWITGSEITADGGARYNASEI
jgi:NAD(P)-dependent dehydrogenase (short-subunit alcohol dehydrogenase family)